MNEGPRKHSDCKATNMQENDVRNHVEAPVAVQWRRSYEIEVQVRPCRKVKRARISKATTVAVAAAAAGVVQGYKMLTVVLRAKSTASLRVHSVRTHSCGCCTCPWACWCCCAAAAFARSCFSNQQKKVARAAPSISWASTIPCSSFASFAA